MLALSAVSAAVGVAGAVQQSNAAQANARYQSQIAAHQRKVAENASIARKQTLDYQAQVERNNAITAAQNADAVQVNGTLAEMRHRELIRQTKGSARAIQASQGLLLDDPGATGMDLLGDLDEAGAMDVLALRTNTANEVRNLDAQADNFSAQAGLFELASAQDTADFIAEPFDNSGTTFGNVAPALINGATGVAATYYKYKSPTLSTASAFKPTFSNTTSGTRLTGL